MDRGTGPSIIHATYVNKNNFITRKTSVNQQFTLAESFPTPCEAEIKLKLPEVNIKAYISAPFHVTFKNCNNFWYRLTLKTMN